MTLQLLYHCELPRIQLPKGRDHAAPRVRDEYARYAQTDDGYERPRPAGGTECRLEIEAYGRHEKRVDRKEEGVDCLPSGNQSLGCLHQHAILLKQQTLSIPVEIGP